MLVCWASGGRHTSLLGRRAVQNPDTILGENCLIGNMCSCCRSTSTLHVDNRQRTNNVGVKRHTRSFVIPPTFHCIRGLNHQLSLRRRMLSDEYNNQYRLVVLKCTKTVDACNAPRTTELSCYAIVSDPDEQCVRSGILLIGLYGSKAPKISINCKSQNSSIYIVDVFREETAKALIERVQKPRTNVKMLLKVYNTFVPTPIKDLNEFNNLLSKQIIGCCRMARCSSLWSTSIWTQRRTPTKHPDVSHQQLNRHSRIHRLEFPIHSRHHRGVYAVVEDANGVAACRIPIQMLPPEALMSFLIERERSRSNSNALPVTT